MARRTKRATRTTLIPFAVTLQERREFRQLASRRRTALSELIRQILFREVELEKRKKNRAA